MKARCIAIVLFMVVISCNAQDKSQKTRREVWPEFDIYLPLKTKFRLLIFVSSQKASETGDSLEGQGGAALDYFWKKRWTLRSGYIYGKAQGTSDRFPEQTIFLEQSYERTSKKQFVWSDRNRQEFRWLNGDYSMRFRNRLKLARPFAVAGRSLVPYGSAEVFYDTRFSTFNRYRLIAGGEFHFRKRDIRLLNVRRQQVVNLYYLWQEDTRSQTKHVRAFGITFEVHF
ncbi:MAG TPA: DUF2490 domain-containing protein [Pyrinomonadaceae bacterium]